MSRDKSHGFTLMELVIVIVMIGVLATIATRKIGSSIETAKYEQTKHELDELAHAMVGNPELYASGARTDFGYVGDIGALPPNLDALTQNPGSYSTWNGPYVISSYDSDGFKKDAWGTDYNYTDTLLRSSGSGANIDKVFASSSSDLLANTVEGYVVDASNDKPGATYKDSILVRITYPDGSGGMATASTSPSAKGNFSFSNIPIGNHTLRVIYIPDTDTASYNVTINPGSVVKLNVVFPADLW